MNENRITRPRLFVEVGRLGPVAFRGARGVLRVRAEGWGFLRVCGVTAWVLGHVTRDVSVPLDVPVEVWFLTLAGSLRERALSSSTHALPAPAVTVHPAEVHPLAFRVSPSCSAEARPPGPCLALPVGRGDGPFVRARATSAKFDIVLPRSLSRVEGRRERLAMPADYDKEG